MSTGQMIMRASGLSIVAGLLALVTGCATTPWQSYSGTSLPDSQVARIAAETKSQTFWQKLIERQPVPLQITHVDGLPLGSFWGVRGNTFQVVDVLPGEHSVSAVLGEPPLISASEDKRQAYRQSGFGQTLKVNAKTGHKYIIKFIDKRLPLVCWMENEATGEVVSDVKPPAAK